MEKFIVRKATPDDAYGISYVNVHTWYTTYKGLMPDIILENRLKNLDEKAIKTREIIENGGNYLVAENTETKEIVGMLIYGASRNEDYSNAGEIIAIYVLKQYQKLGIGKKIFLAGINELIKLGYKDMVIDVLKGNKTINFYKKYGGKTVGERYDEFGDFKLHENILLFENIESIN